MWAVLWDFNRFTPGKPCQKRVLPKMPLLILIDLSMNASPQDRLIVTQNQSFLKPRESGASPDPSREQAVASAALAASFKRAWSPAFPAHLILEL
jgi:hypothetical protein